MSPLTHLLRLASLLPLLLPLSATAAVEVFAGYRLGEDGSLGANKLPLDGGTGARHFTSAIAGASAQVNGDGLWAPGSSASISSAATTGWYATNLFNSLPTDNFAVGVFARASGNSGASRDVFTLGSANGSIKLSLSSTGWAASAHNVAWIGPANGVSGSFVPGQWVHLALIRKGGTSTFYLNGVAKGTWAGVPVHNSPHLAVNPGGAPFFNGEVDEAKVLSFDAAASNADILTALWGAATLPPTPPAELLAEQSFPTVAGKRHVAIFTLTPAAGQGTLPVLSLGIEGSAALVESAVPRALPLGGGASPFRVAFTADSAQTTLRLSRPGGSNSPAPAITAVQVLPAVEPLPSDQPSATQKEQIERRYGMFIHFGINTFHNQQWTDGTKPPSSYAPTGLDVDQWVKTARDAGMRHIILTAKHHDGFCLWDSPWTDYDVASSPLPTDVVAAAAVACKKYGIGLGIYYSLWDRHDPSYGDDAAYNQYMLRQLAELLDGRYGPICELWLDGGWDKANYRWPNSEIYDLTKRLQPGCLVSTNWSIGMPANPDTSAAPANQQEGYPIRYFPNDFRLGDPELPKFPDPKRFSHAGQSYYLPFEATITLSSANYWFYDTRDTGPKSLDTLANFYDIATAQDNILILNAPPDRSGVIREVDRQGLFQLRDLLGLKPGMPLPKNVTGAATGTASATWNNDLATHGPQQALDGNPATRWACGPAGTVTASFEVDFGTARSFDRVLIDEYEEGGSGRIQSFQLQVWNGNAWQSIHSGTTCGRRKRVDVPRQTSNKLRLLIDNATNAPSLWELQAIDSSHAFSSWRDSHFPGSGTALAADWQADPDGDGLPNRIEFVLGGDPAAGTALPAPLANGEGGGMLQLDLPWNPQAAAGFAAVRYSLDLTAWHDARIPAHAGVTRLADTATHCRWAIDPRQQAQWFYRLE